MIGKLIVSHGGLAHELLAAAEVITGQVNGLKALCLDWKEGCDEAKRKIAEELPRLDQGSGVLLLTDMVGDTPCNAALSFLQPGRVEVVTGVNLPMVVRLVCSTSSEPPSVTELAEWLAEKARGSIRVGSHLKPADRDPDQGC